MPPKIADRNRTDTNSYTCDDLHRVYIFHKLSTQRSICMTCSDVCKRGSSQFIYNFMFLLYIIQSYTLASLYIHCFSVLCSVTHSPCETRATRDAFLQFFFCPSAYIIDKKITASLQHFPLLGFSILKLFGCSFSLTGKSHFLDSSSKLTKHTLRTWSPELPD